MDRRVTAADAATSNLQGEAVGTDMKFLISLVLAALLLAGSGSGRRSADPAPSVEAAEAPRRRLHAANLLSSYFGSLRGDAPELKDASEISGLPSSDPCPTCGMAQIPARSRTFLKFLGSDPAANPKRDE